MPTENGRIEVLAQDVVDKIAAGGHFTLFEGE